MRLPEHIANTFNEHIANTFDGLRAVRSRDDEITDEKLEKVARWIFSDVTLHHLTELINELRSSSECAVQDGEAFQSDSISDGMPVGVQTSPHPAPERAVHCPTCVCKFDKSQRVGKVEGDDLSRIFGIWTVTMKKVFLEKVIPSTPKPDKKEGER